MNKTLIGILSGVGGMFGWGTADFFANTATDEIGNFKASFWSQLVGLLVIIIATFIFLPPFSFSILIIFLILETGVAFALGMLFYYRAFEIGNVSIVSTLINTYTLFVIGISWLFYGQRLIRFQGLAIVMILLGGVLVSVNFKDLKNGTMSVVSGVKETLIAAVMFGVFFWPVNEYLVENADWLSVNLLTKLVTTLTILTIAHKQTRSLTLSDVSKKIQKVIIAIGLLDTIGTLSVSFGLSVADAIIIQPIASTLSIVTISLAMIFLKEKISRVQGAGIVLTIGGIILTGI